MEATKKLLRKISIELGEEGVISADVANKTVKIVSEKFSEALRLQELNKNQTRSKNVRRRNH